MTRVYLADALPEERSALRLVLLDMNMEVVGEAADWPTMLANAPATRLDMLLVSWDLVPIDGSSDQLSGCPSTSRTLGWRRCVYPKE
jgi:hypothetical protein